MLGEGEETPAAVHLIILLGQGERQVPRYDDHGNILGTKPYIDLIDVVESHGSSTSSTFYFYIEPGLTNDQPLEGGFNIITQ